MWGEQGKQGLYINKNNVTNKVVYKQELSNKVFYI